VLAATLAMIPVLVIDNDATGSLHTAAVAAKWLIWLIFALEYAVVLRAALRRRRCGRSG
jgi:hypothetical protein